MMKKRLIFFISIYILVVAVAVSAVSSTYAIWLTHAHDSLFVATQVEDENPSLKYQMFVPVKLSGNSITMTQRKYEPMSGTFSITDSVYSFTLDSSESVGAVAGYAMVGWFGGVALEYIQVAATTSLVLESGGTLITKNVVSIMALNDENDSGDFKFKDYRLAGNSVIKTLIIGPRVEEIDRGVCYAMTNLEYITFETLPDSVPIYIREYAFGACSNLKQVDQRRSNPVGWDTSRIYEGSYRVI